MVRQAHHPEQRRRVNPNDQNSKSQTFWTLRIEIWNLPFDVAQGGEPVEPFVIWVLQFGA